MAKLKEKQQQNSQTSKISDPKTEVPQETKELDGEMEKDLDEMEKKEIGRAHV